MIISANWNFWLIETNLISFFYCLFFLNDVAYFFHKLIYFYQSFFLNVIFHGNKLLIGKFCKDIDVNLKYIVSKIKCCLTDRSPIKKKWQIQVTELNCNLHPLKTVPSKTGKILSELKYGNSKCSWVPCMANNCDHEFPQI